MAKYPQSFLLLNVHHVNHELGLLCLKQVAYLPKKSGGWCQVETVIDIHMPRVAADRGNAHPVLVEVQNFNTRIWNIVASNPEPYTGSHRSQETSVVAEHG